MRPALIYGAETWTKAKEDKKRLAVQEMRMLRWTQGVTREDRIENRYVRGSLRVTEISKKIAGRRLTWAWHVRRRTANDRSVAKEVTEMELIQ